MYAGFDGRYRKILGLGDLLLSLPFDKLQPQNLCGGFRQLCERRQDFVTDRKIFKKLCPRIRQRLVVFREEFGALPALLLLRTVLRISNAIEDRVCPRRERCPLLRRVAVGIEVHFGKSVLHDLFSVLWRVKYRLCPPQKRGLVATHNEGKKFGLALTAREHL